MKDLIGSEFQTDEIVKNESVIRFVDAHKRVSGFMDISRDEVTVAELGERAYPKKKNKRSLFNKAIQEVSKTLLMCLMVAVASVCVLALALYYVSPIVENVLTFGLVGELDYLVVGSAIVVMMYAVSSVWKMIDMVVK